VRGPGEARLRGGAASEAPELKAALVTGARGGIGAAIVERLEADGWQVHGVDVEDADLATREGNRAVVDAALARFGRLDALVPNAGFQHVSPVEDFPEDRWDALVAVMLTSPFLLAKYAWPALRASGDGRIVAVASVHGLVASPFKAGYVAAKHGLIGLVKSLALEGAEVGITASAVCPAFTRTPLVEGQIAAQAAAHGVSEERVLEDVILAPQAVKRLLEPAEVAAVVAFLLGPEGRAFSGAPVTMDLGWTAR
jgi:3-hydroxybutyrate dehydrogenase